MSTWAEYKAEQARIKAQFAAAREEALATAWETYVTALRGPKQSVRVVRDNVTMRRKVVKD